MAKTPITKTQLQDGNRIKRSVLRVLGLNILTSGLYNFYWFFVTKNQLKRELKNDQHVGWQTVGLIVPILQAFILYWMYRDINRVRDAEKLPAFPAVWYVVVPYVLIAVALVIGVGAIVSIAGAIGAGANGHGDTATGLAGAGLITGLFALLTLALAGILEFVFLGLAVSKLNQYWDSRTGGQAAAAGWGKGEIAVVVVGLLVTIMNYSNSNSRNAKDFNNVNKPGSPEVGAVTLVRT